MRNISNSLRRRIRIGSAVASTLCIAAAGLALAAPAQAATSCMVMPSPPVAYTDTDTGRKMVYYSSQVYCYTARDIEIQQERWERDPWNPDDYLGTSTFRRHLRAGDVITIDNHRTLVNTEPGEEEVYQKVRIRERGNGDWSGWSGWNTASG